MRMYSAPSLLVHVCATKQRAFPISIQVFASLAHRFLCDLVVPGAKRIIKYQLSQLKTQAMFCENGFSLEFIPAQTERLPIFVAPFFVVLNHVDFKPCSRLSHSLGSAASAFKVSSPNGTLSRQACKNMRLNLSCLAMRLFSSKSP
jgi:hypothetical protein